MRSKSLRVVDAHHVPVVANSGCVEICEKMSIQAVQVFPTTSEVTLTTDVCMLPTLSLIREPRNTLFGGGSLKRICAMTFANSKAGVEPYQCHDNSPCRL